MKELKERLVELVGIPEQDDPVKTLARNNARTLLINNTFKSQESQVSVPEEEDKEVLAIPK
jgi:hypothetical protein